MRRINISLFTLFAIMTCIMLLVVAIYERHRANDIESKSITISSPEYRAIIDQDWQIMKRELELGMAMQEFENSNPSFKQSFNNAPAISVGSRRQLANIRNAKLKLSREKQKLQNMRAALLENILSGQ